MGAIAFTFSTSMKLTPSLWCFLLTLCGFVYAQAAPAFEPGGVSPKQIKERYDVVVAGAGTGGCGAAIQAARLGASVLLLEETDWIGGQMNAAAVTSMDEGGTLVRGRGLYRELVERIEGYYRPLGVDPETAYHYGHICTEPRVGRKILHEMLEAERRGPGKLDLVLRARVTKALKKGDTVTRVEIEIVSKSGKTTHTVQSKVLIDATEWGDVIPLTGARYRVGNCSSDNIDMKQRVQDNTWTAVVRQYPKEVPTGFLLTQPPPGYDKAHPRFVKTLTVGDDTISSKQRPWNWLTFIGYRGMPDSTRPPGSRPITRTHLNFNNDYNSTVAELEDPVQRERTNREMRLRTLQLIYYIQNTLGMKDWAVANDEGYDTPYNRAEIDAWVREQPELEPYREVLYHFPVIPYVRESRRIIGLHTLKSGEIDRRPGKQPVQFPTSVAIGDYPVDMHGSMTPRYLEMDLDREDDIPATFGAHGKGPFTIPFESFIPEKVDGFLPAEKNISQSRMGNGATRLQPHTMLMGQAAGAIAALAVKHQVQPRALDPVLVQSVLVDARDPLNLTPLKDVALNKPEWPAIQLVTARGMLPLKDGRFAPRQPVTGAELAGIVSTLAPAAPAAELPAADKSVTRAAFASAIQGVSDGSNVKVKFTSKPEDREKAITRSEAAQVVAEFLKLRATAKQKETPQTLVWNSVRPASEASRNDVTSTTVRDVQDLHERKLISSPDYWLENAVEGGFCDGDKVGALLLRAARTLEPNATQKDAVTVLAKNRIFGAPEYWEKNAVPGGKCAGHNVARVIRNIARHIVFRTGK